MPRLRIIFLASLALLLLLASVAVVNKLLQEQQIPAAVSVVLYPEGKEPVTIKAEVASTPGQIATGLMFRKSLGENEGMLFVFPSAAVQNFWMKNTLIPLDMIFIAENMTIVKIHYAVPCTADPCLLYNSQNPVKYVLEVNGNFTADYKVREGSPVTFQ